jgi:hypothetical protein
VREEERGMQDRKERHTNVKVLNEKVNKYNGYETESHGEQMSGRTIGLPSTTECVVFILLQHGDNRISTPHPNIS